MIDQAIADSNAINPSPEFNWRSLLGIPNTSVGNQFANARGQMTNVPNYGQNYYSSSLKDGRVNRNPAFNLHGDMNVASGFGAGLGAAGDKRIARIQDTIAGFEDQWGNLKESDEAAYNAKLAAHQEKLRQFMIQNKKYKTALGGQGPKEEVIKDKITETIKPIHIPHGGGNQGGGGGYQDQGGGYSTQGGFTQETQASPSTGRGHHSWADGGRIGYNRGRVVNPGGYAGVEAGNEKSFLENLKSGFGQIFSGQTGAVMGGDEEKINEFLTEQGWGIDLAPETIKMIIQMHEGGSDLETISALTETDSGTVTSILQKLNMKADGGRIGYALAGPVGVEQETDLIEGPQGGEEFQETVVEGQEQPSREQLEALAMELFQLPLEELDDQQLLVVYQEAMQGQPMEEAVQEDEVQFAAQGGLAGLL